MRTKACDKLDCAPGSISFCRAACRAARVYAPHYTTAVVVQSELRGQKPFLLCNWGKNGEQLQAVFSQSSKMQTSQPSRNYVPYDDVPCSDACRLAVRSPCMPRDRDRVLTNALTWSVTLLSFQVLHINQDDQMKLLSWFHVALALLCGLAHTVSVSAQGEGASHEHA